MSNNQKKGMQFFKKFSGEQKPSILMGMKIKPGKETKPVAQTETNLNFIEKKTDLSGSGSFSKDDNDIKKRENQAEYNHKGQQKGEQVNFKKGSSKLPQNHAKVQKVPAMQKIVETNSTEQNNLGQETSSSIHQKAIEQKKRHSDEDFRLKKSNKVSAEGSSSGAERSDESPKHKKAEGEKKNQIGQKKRTEKPAPVGSHGRKFQNEPSSTGRKGSALRESQKVKKSDREQVLQQINQLTVKLVGIIVYQKQIKLQILNTKSAVSELREMVGRSMSEQGMCAQREEYEQADSLQTEIKEGERKIQEMELELGYMQEQIVKQEQEEINLLKTQNSNFKRLSRRLKLIELQLQDEAANLKRQQMQKIEGLRNRQQTERKKIQRIEKDISYQSEQISECEKMFRQELDSKMNPLLEQKGVLEGSRNELQGEIRELERRLKEKKASLGEVVKHLKGVTESIDQIRQSFKEQSQKLQERKNKLEIVENERDEMQLTITDLENAIANETRTMDSRFQQKMGEANELFELAKGIEQKQGTFDDDLESRRVALDNYLLNVKCVKQFESKHRAEREKFKEVEYKKSTISGEISKLQEKREELKKKIPALQQEQKKFADQKNFKAAGVKKGEIKEINEQLAKVKQRLDGYLGQEHALQIELQEMSAMQKESNEEQTMLNRNLAVSQVKLNREKLNKLEEYHNDIGKSSGLPMKEKERLTRELEQEIQRLKEESKQLNMHFQLSVQDKKEIKQQQEVVHKGNEGEELVDESGHVHVHKEEEVHDEQGKYYPLVIDAQGEEEELEETEDGVYVPLQLDD